MPVQDAYGEYLESQVLTASPLELVEMLYRAAHDATRKARAHLAEGRIRERSRQICKAHAILVQLSVSLDYTRGRTLSRRLAELYDYMQRRLLEANIRQQAEPLVEVEGLLNTLLEGWEAIAKQALPLDPGAVPAEATSEAAAYNPPAASPFMVPETMCAAQSWSF